VSASALGRLATTWHGLAPRRSGLDALLDVIEQLQGAPLPASLLEREILPARIDGYEPGALDVLASAGEVAWVGLEPLGERDGRIAVCLADHLAKLLPPAASSPDLDERANRVLQHLRRQGASFFAALHQAVGGGYPGETVDALWDLVWRGLVTNDTFHPLRAFTQPPVKRTRRHDSAQPFRSRRLTPATAEGRWSLVEVRAGGRPSPTEWAAAVASQLLARHGILTREAVAVESLPGGFSVVYDVLKAMEDAGRVRRGYFVGGLGATQFALPAAVDLLRAVRDEPEVPQTVCLAATDPANPYGAILKWPGDRAEGKAGPTRSVGAGVILVNGALAAYIGRADRQILTFLPEDEPARSLTAREVARTVHHLATGGSVRDGMLIAAIDGVAAPAHPLAPFLIEAGFVRRPGGFQAAPQRD
jgi:ATP-dependent Lhr-like helicase